MKKLLIFLFGLLYATISAEENFVLLDDQTGEIYYTLGSHIDEQVSPCSTFKIFLSLVGFDSGILKDEDHPQWPYQEGYASFLSAWKADQTPRSWIKLSCIWYSQVLVEKLGLGKIQNYLEKMLYGNQDFTGDPGKNNGLTQAWLGSSLKISPREQVRFLQKLVRGYLPVSAHALEMTKQIMFADELSNGWQLFGKTGAWFQDEEQNGGMLGWFVGWIEKEGRAYIFAYNIHDQTIDLSQRIPRVKQLLLESRVMEKHDY